MQTTTVQITGFEGPLKVTHTKYLMLMGLGLSEAKAVTDDVLAGHPREVCVPVELAELHAETLRLIGARVAPIQGRKAA